MTLQVDISLARSGFSLTARFNAGPGVTVLFGPSGSGKTTILNAVAGLQPFDRGAIFWNGESWATVPTHRRKVGFVFQDGRLFPHMTVRKNLTYGAGKAAALVKIVGLLGLEHLLNRYPSTLSGGERQRVALGRALLCDPEILCMDEPLSALDAQRRQEVLPFIEKIAADVRIPILYVTHDIAELTRLADQIVLLDHGQIVRHGPTDQVMSDPAMVRYFPGRNLGAVINGTVGDTESGLTDVTFPGATLRLGNVQSAQDAPLRLRIAAQDVILAKTKPDGLSALNVLPAVIENMTDEQGGVLVTLALGPTRILAKITDYSANNMGLAEQDQVFAIIKATAVDPVTMD